GAGAECGESRQRASLGTVAVNDVEGTVGAKILSNPADHGQIARVRRGADGQGEMVDAGNARQAVEEHLVDPARGGDEVHLVPALDQTFGQVKHVPARAAG